MDVKICGLKTEETLAAALAGGASHVGFIFFPKSPRFVEPEEVARLRPLAAGRANAVAVTVDADDAFLERIVRAMAPDLLQLHGAESPERVAAIKARYRLPVVKAFAIRERADLDRIRPYLGVADRLLFDARPPQGSELPGGNGVSFDWTLLAGVDPAIAYFLSGGINAGNIGQALAAARPAGIDVSSGVESAPGVKDIALIDGFFRALRAAERSRAA